MPLIKLDQFNRERQSNYDLTHQNSPRRNGIACPKCGEELMDSTPMIILASYPPQLNIHCINCKYAGYRIK